MRKDGRDYSFLSTCLTNAKKGQMQKPDVTPAVVNIEGMLNHLKIVVQLTPRQLTDLQLELQAVNLR